MLGVRLAVDELKARNLTNQHKTLFDMNDPKALTNVML
jgi:hypothetical protein